MGSTGNSCPLGFGGILIHGVPFSIQVWVSTGKLISLDVTFGNMYPYSDSELEEAQSHVGWSAPHKPETSKSETQGEPCGAP